MRKTSLRSGSVLVSVVLVAGSAHAYGSATELYPLSSAAGFSQEYLQPSGAGVAAGGQIVAYGVPSAGGNYHALVWLSSGNAVDLGPSSSFNFTYTVADATDGSQQVGYGPVSGDYQAVLWSGSSSSAVALNPSGYDQSEAAGVGGGQQVGWGEGSPTGGAENALLWTGSAGSALNLNPSGYSSSIAYGTNGTQQVGQAVNGDGSQHALLWNGSATNYVDLGPSFLADGGSVAYGVGGNQQVGAGFGSATDENDHALLWTGTAGSAVDLNPTGYDSSYANATNGAEQVGYGLTSGTGQANALAWDGSAASFVDLQTLLPGGVTWTQSYANSIDANGDIFGIAYGTNNGNNVVYAVEWTDVFSVPEPSSLCAIALGSIALLTRRRQEM